MIDPMVWLILLPLAWGSLAFLLGSGRGAWPSILGMGAQLWLAFRLAARVSASGPGAHAVGGWGAPLGIDLAADGLSVVMLLLAQVVALPLSIYARAYFAPGAAEGRYFWPLSGFLLAGINALFLSADLFNLYVTLELVGLAAVALVVAGGGAVQVSAALRYLFASLLGSGMYLMGVALIYGACGTVSVAGVERLVAADAPAAVWMAWGLMGVGLMLKTALFPFHFWLPPAHGGAPAPVSALLSALVVKAAFYVFLRLWLGPFGPLAARVEAAAFVPVVLGTVAIFWGSWKAIRARGIKMLVAYSTVAQLGYLFLIFPLLGERAALPAGVMQACAHGLAKAAMFAAAGALVKATGQEMVDGIAGAADRLPLTLSAFGLAGVTLMGLPPSSGFLAKWLLIEAALARGYWFIALVALSGGLLAAVYVFRVLRHAFRTAAAEREVVPVPRTLEWTAFALGTLSVLLGLRGVEWMALLFVGGPT